MERHGLYQLDIYRWVTNTLYAHNSSMNLSFQVTLLSMLITIKSERDSNTLWMLQIVTGLQPWSSRTMHASESALYTVQSMICYASSELLANCFSGLITTKNLLQISYSGKWFWWLTSFLHCHSRLHID